MNVAALYDIHGMPWALEAVLADGAGDADAIVIGGDVFGGPYPEEAYEAVIALDAVCVRGNAEDDDPRTASWPLTAKLDGVVYCHATPTDNRRITTARTPDADVVRAFGALGTFVIGHSHHQFDRVIGELRIVNAGSVGMAYEDEVAAFWALVVDGDPQLRSTPFDIERAVREVRASSWPDAEEFIAENLLQPVGRDVAISHFEAQR
jgi:predicted phosphodiesterase